MTPGQAAYDAWHKRVMNIGLRWSDLPPLAQAGWEEVAQAAIDWYKTNNVVVPEPNGFEDCSRNGDGHAIFCDCTTKESRNIFHSMCDVTDPCSPECQ